MAGLLIVLLASVGVVRWARYRRRAGRKAAPRRTWFILAGAAIFLALWVVIVAPVLAGR